MIIRTMIAALALILCAWTGAATARDQIGSRGPVTIDPAKAYIFFRSTQRVPVRFLREVTPGQYSAWRDARASALARAGGRGQTQREASARACRGGGHGDPRCVSPADRDAPVTDESFVFPPPELDNFVTVNRGPQFSPDPDGDTYLIAVQPGTYILYGQSGAAGGGGFGAVAAAMAGATETCLCMGSVRFEAQAGRIVDIGQIRFPVSDDEDEVSTGRLASLQLRPPTAAMELPDRLRGLPVDRAELRAADKLPNYFGVQIDRHPAIRGILAYRRDIVIDGRTGAPVAPAPAP